MPPEGVFVDVSVTKWRSCGVRDSGKVVCWGGKAPGEWLESGLARVAAESSCALGAQGELLCWRTDYRVSDGSAVNHLMEAPRGAAGRFVDLSEQWPCAVRAGGGIVCLEAESTTVFERRESLHRYYYEVSEEYYRQQADLGVFREAAAVGFFAETAHGGDCGVLADGRLDCWTMHGISRPPDGVGPFGSAAVRYPWACGVHADGSLGCWDVRSGERADAETVYGEPVEGPFERVFEGLCLVDEQGALAQGCKLEGFDSYRTGTFATGPFAVEWVGYSEPPGTRFVDFAQTDSHACAIRIDGTLACWGSNADEEIVERMPDA